MSFNDVTTTKKKWKKKIIEKKYVLPEKKLNI